MIRKIRKFYHSWWIYLIPSVFGLIITMITLIVVVPTIRDLFKENKFLRERQNVLNQLFQKRELLQSVNSNQTQRYLQIADEALPSDKDTVSVLFSMENLAKELNIEVSQIDFSPGLISSASAEPESQASQTKPASTKKQKTDVPKQTVLTNRDVPVIPIQITVSGNLEQIIELLEKLRKTRRVYEIVNFSFGELSDISATKKMRLTLYTYYLPPVLTISEINSALPAITDDEKNMLETIADYEYISRTVEIDPSLFLNTTDLFQYTPPIQATSSAE